jgi:Tfp pilus assembly protein PilX
MEARNTIRKRRTEAGIALLISIFVLLLISVVAIALIVSSGTESALAGNYRSATGVYYAALSGLEEARGRLLPKNPSSFKNTAGSFLPAPGTTLPIGSVAYVLNPGPTDAYATQLTAYPDTQYDTEFGSGALAGATVTTTNSVWNVSPLNSLSIPGPLYKWVRINAVSEKSLNIDVDADTLANSTTPLYYDGAHFSNSSSAGPQVLEITSFAVLPNGSQKLVQYLVAPTMLNLSFKAALTLDGNTPQFTAATSPNFWVKGNDQGGVGTCNPTGAAFIAVGSTIPPGSFNSTFQQPGNASGIPIGPPPPLDLRTHYTNSLHVDPDIEPPTLSPNLQTVGGLNALVQTIQQNADATIPPGSIQSDSTNFMPAAMSPSNPMTIVVNGDLTFNGWHSTGYGLLLVTGDFTYDPDASWNGIILVIGKGRIYSYQGNSATTQIQGAVFLAKTVDASNNPLASTSAPISSSFDFSSTPITLSNGIYYSSCWIQASLPNLGYTILSFHEISQ